MQSRRHCSADAIPLRLSLPFVRRSLLWVAIVLPLAALAAGAREPDWPAQRFWALYVAPLFCAAPLWVRLRVAEARRLDWRAALDATVLGLSFARFLASGLLPFSGHMLFLTYSAIATTSFRYRVLAAVLIAETTFFKFWIWKDWRSWLIGLALGIIAALPVVFSRRKQPSNEG